MEPPTVWRWGLPVYPHAVAAGVSTAAASIAFYHTGDGYRDVVAWYRAELPRSAQAAFAPDKGEATFALFDASSRRTVHLQQQMDGTTIVFTQLQMARRRPHVTGR